MDTATKDKIMWAVFTLAIVLSLIASMTEGTFR